MQDSRMMAEVAPPGDCAMPKVSGRRIATPFAPPRPGSTPMITPRITPTNIRPTFSGESATLKPCISDWISCMSAQPQQAFQRALRQRHLEPQLEYQIERHRRAHADGGHITPEVHTPQLHSQGDI